MGPWCRWLLLLYGVIVHLCQPTLPAAPVITLFKNKAVATLPESTKEQLELIRIQSCTDADGDSVRLFLGSVTPTSPCGKCFALQPCFPTKAQPACLYFNPGQGTLSISAASSYTIVVQCTDGTDTVPVYLDIQIEDNQDPKVDNPKGGVATMSLRRIQQLRPGDEVYDVDVSDREGDPISYTMSSSPQSDLLGIGFGDGVIRATKDMRLLCGDSLVLTVNAQDVNQKQVPPITLVGDFVKWANRRPEITNTETVVEMRENADHRAPLIGTDVLRISVTDDTQYYPTLLYQMRAEPKQGLEYYELFVISGRAKIQTRARLNYEYAPLRSVKLFIDVTDGFCSATTYSVTIVLTDVNELPEIFPDSVERTVYEGFINLDPGWTVRDPDENENIVWQLLSGGGGEFDVDSATGFISSKGLRRRAKNVRGLRGACEELYIFKKCIDGCGVVHMTCRNLNTILSYSVTGEFDVDPNTMQRVQTMEVRVRDRRNEQAKAKIRLTILDKNDNPPVFQSTLYVLTATSCTSAGALIGKISATDDDSGFQGNNQLIYSGSGTFIKVLSSGDVTLLSQCTPGYTETIQGKVTDQGKFPGPLEGVPTTITFSCDVCPEPTNSSAAVEAIRRMMRIRRLRKMNASDILNGEAGASSGDFVTSNLAWIVPTAIVGLAVLGLFLFFMRRFYSRAGSRWNAKSSLRQNSLRRNPKAKRSTKAPEDSPKRREPALPREDNRLAPLEQPPPESEPVLASSSKDTYVDRDQLHMPTRDVLPATVKEDQVVEEREKMEVEEEHTHRLRARQRVQDDYRKEMEEDQAKRLRARQRVQDDYRKEVDEAERLRARQRVQDDYRKEVDEAERLRARQRVQDDYRYEMEEYYRKVEARNKGKQME